MVVNSDDEAISKADRNLLLMLMFFGAVHAALGVPAAEGLFFDAIGFFLSFAALAAGGAKRPQIAAI